MKDLAGNSEARGRNGWFVPRKMQAWIASPAFRDQPITVEIYSKQVGSYAPVTLWLSIEDAKTIVGQITNAIVDAENPAVAAENPAVAS